MPSRRPPSSCAVARRAASDALCRVGGELRAARLARGEDLRTSRPTCASGRRLPGGAGSGRRSAHAGPPLRAGLPAQLRRASRDWTPTAGRDRLKAMAEPVARGRAIGAAAIARWPALARCSPTGPAAGRRDHRPASSTKRLPTELPAPRSPPDPPPLLPAGPRRRMLVAFDPGRQACRSSPARSPPRPQSRAVLESADEARRPRSPDLRRTTAGRLVLVARANGWVQLRGADRRSVRSGRTGQRATGWFCRTSSDIWPVDRQCRRHRDPGRRPEHGPARRPGRGRARPGHWSRTLLASRLGRPH